MSKNLLFIIGLFLIISVSFIIGLKILRAETTTITCSSESIIGDANGDGDITLADASLVNDVYFGRKPKPSNICCLDANGDGDITPRDVQYIKSYYMKDGGETGNVGKKCVEEGYSESFETGFGGWTTDYYLQCEFDNPPCSPLEWSITRSREQAYDGAYSLMGYLNGDHDDGTIWVERAFEAAADSEINVEISFYLWSISQSDLNTWPVLAYIGLSNPEEELDFNIIGRTDEVAGWKKYSYSTQLRTNSDGTLWVAFGFGATGETERIYFMDLVSVKIEEIVEKECYSNSDCSATQFCEFPTGECKGPGICVQKPEICPTLYDPVCGCDGKTYSNDCFRKMAKVSKDYDGECKTTTCTDTDGGKNYYVKGSVSICYLTSEGSKYSGSEGSETCTSPVYDTCTQCTGLCPTNDKDCEVSCGAVKEYYCGKNEAGTSAVTAGIIQSETYVCPNGCEDGACIKGEEPYCSAVGTRSEGWYQHNELIKYDNCDGCHAVCKATGTNLEGWYSSCTNNLIKSEKCGEVTCLGEGEGYAVVPNAPKCCSGLTSIGCEKPDSEGNCQPCEGAFYCTYCGNGICGLGENICNCPEDCCKNYDGECKTVTCSSESIIGDANGDGDITLADASLVNDVYFGRKPKPSNICCLDANGDGDITPRDVQYIKSYYMKDGGETGNVGKKCVEVGTCTDSDGGKNYYDKGTVSRCNSADAAYKCETATDECAYCTGVCLEPPCEVTCGAVKEYYCEGSEIKSETYVCPTGYTCKDGACIKVVSSAPAPTPTSSECLPDGTLVKLPDDPKVYVIKDCKKKWIETIEEFQQGGYDWSDVQETSPEVVNAYTDYLEVVANLIKATNQSKVYKIINNKRFWIPTAEAFTQMGNDWLDIQDVDESGIEQYPRLRLAKLADDPKVYYLTEDGLKRHIPSVEVFNSYGNDWTDIAEIASIELNAYPDSILIRLTGDYKVYKLENNQKRWIKTAEVFNNLGYDWNKIAPVNDTEIEAYEEGDTID